MTVRSFRALMRASLVLPLFLLGCVDAVDAGTKGTSLYVFDGAESATNRLLIFDNLDDVVANLSTAKATRTLSGAAFDKVKTLGWGGMALDPNTNRLYLVSQSGDVVRVERIRSQKGTVAANNELATFRLGQSQDRLPNGVFGQAAVDPQTGTLFVTETNDSTGRIWVVESPGSMFDGGVAPLKTIAKDSSDDQGATGVAVAPGGMVYAYFEGGAQIQDNTQTKYDNQRLRQGASSRFNHNQNVIIGASTGLVKYGSLAYDYGNQRLYLARHLTDGNPTGGGNPVLVYTPSQFSIGFNQTATQTLGPSTLTNLRFISHAGNKDWLAGATSTGSTGASSVLIWKEPAKGSAPVTLTAGSGVIVRGLAMDGNN